MSATSREPLWRRFFGRRSRPGEAAAPVESRTTPGRLLHSIDEPVLWRVPGPTVTIAGWCLVENAERAAPLAVRARLGAREYPARQTLRPDVAAAFPHLRGAGTAGFVIEVVPTVERATVVLEAEAAGEWREFFRAEIVIDRAAALPGARRYAEWAARFDTPAPAHLQALAAHVATGPRLPRFRIVVLGTAADLSADEGLAAQVYREFEMVPPGSWADALGGADAWIVALGAGDRLAPHALARMAAEIAAHPEARWVYSDEDVWPRDGLRSDPWFKPGWDPDLHASLDFIGRLAAVRADVLAATGSKRPASWDDWWSVAHRATAALRPDEILHVPHVLYHRAAAEPRRALETRDASLRIGRSDAGDGAAARADPTIDRRAADREVGRDKEEAFVAASLVIPTRDRADLLERCVRAVIERTDHPRLEIVLVDHASSEPAACALLAEFARDPRVRIVQVEDGPFNFSALVNAGVAAAHGEVLVLLNNDVEPPTAGWLQPLVTAARRPEIGCVGTRLDYPDGRIQHVGIALGVHGVAGMPFRGAPGDTRDPAGRTWAAHRVAAVTAACLAVRRETWEVVGGFDAAELPVTFNDVDFCLRVGTLGLRNLVLPGVRLIHHESATRGGGANPRAAAEFALMRGRWAARLTGDPAYNPNLSVDSEEATPAFPPRVPPAWALGTMATAESAARDAQLVVRKQEETNTFRAELAAFLATAETLDFGSGGGAEQLSVPRASVPPPGSESASATDETAGSSTALKTGGIAPAVSVLVVLHNRAELTLRCLRALERTLDPRLELVLVDNASTDETARLLERVRGATIVRNPENRHFLAAANQAAGRARGRLLLFLNNDTEVAPDAIRRAVETLEGGATPGAVGAKLIWPDGRLQEAGSIVWGDGRTQGVGRGEDPTRPEYNFRRPVDYVSGAFLLTPRALFVELGGFDERFAPAYCEESDYCVRLWQHARRVLYEPQAEVRHHEFASSPAGAAAELQERNRRKFVEKHAAWLTGRPVASAAALARWRTAGPARARVLVLEDRIPLPHLGAGFPRTIELLRALVDLECRVTVGALRLPPGPLAETYEVLPREIEIVDLTERLASFLADRLGTFDTLIVCRPQNFQAVADLRARTPALFSGMRLVYDAEAVFARRTLTQATLEGRPFPEAEARALVGRELAAAAEADVVLSVSPAEAAEFRAAGARRVEVVSHCSAIAAEPPGFAARRGLLFVGSFHGDATPNAEALGWFVREVLPLLPADFALEVIGDARAPAVRAMASARVRVLGRVADLRPAYAAARVFVAPGRFGAGVPLKAIEAAAAGVPLVMTPLLAGQLGWTDGAETLVAATGPEFAAAVQRLHDDREVWERMQAAGQAAVRRDFSRDAFAAAVRRIFDHD